MISDRLQYFLDDFWNFQKINQIWTLGPRIYHQHFKRYKKTWDIFETYYFRFENLKFWRCWVCVPNFSNFVILKSNMYFSKFKISFLFYFGCLKLCNSTIWKLWHLKIQKMFFEVFGVWHVWNVRVSMFFLNFETFEISIF